MKITHHSHFKPIVAAIFLALSFAFMGVWIRMMQESFATFQQAYWRLFLAAVMSAWLFRKHFSRSLLRQIRSRDWGIYGLRAILVYAVGVGMYTIAIQHTKLSTAAFVSSLPILGLLAWLIYREKVRRLTLPLIGLSIVGMLLLTNFDARGFHLGIGEWAAIIAMLGFNLGFLLSRNHRPAFNNYQNTTILLALSWVPLLVLSLLWREPLWPAHITVMAGVGLIMSAVFNVVGLYMINYVFSNLKAYVAGNLLLLEGVFATALGLALYNEVLGFGELLGALIILVCAYGISLIDARSNRREVVQSENG